MKNILVVLFIFLCSPVFAANYFVDMNVGGGANDGTSTDDAWQSTKTALEYTTFSDGDIVWIKRDSVWDEGVEATNADITVQDDSVSFIGWPRASKSINCDWTNGSTTVDNVDSNDMDREQHQGRFITGPDGFNYLITDITDANTFVIDREYAGATSADEDVTINEDEDYNTAQAIDDDAWTIKLSTWTDDAEDLPVIDFNSENYQLRALIARYTSFKNIEVKESADGSGVISFSNNRQNELINCLVYTSSNSPLIVATSGTLVYISNTIIEGSGAGASQVGILASSTAGYWIDNSAIYNCGDSGLYISGGNQWKLFNVNIGVEVANGDDDIYLYRTLNNVIGRDVKLGGTNGLVFFNDVHAPASVQITNYNKTLGYNRAFYHHVYAERVPVSGETPNKKYSDYVIKLDGVSGTEINNPNFAQVVHRYQVSQNSSKTYRIYIYNDTGSTLNSSLATDDICLRCRYIAGYDDTSEYVHSAWQYSTETSIADAADADDWDYLEVSAFTPAINSDVECEILYEYSTANDVFIDPLMQHP